jgi:Flp pilus assembly protein TadD
MAEQAATAPVVEPAAAEIQALVHAGKECLARGDLEGALQRFEEVILQFPESCEGHNNLGALYAALGRFGKAEPCFTRVLALLPGNPNVLYNRGVARIRTGDFQGASADFRDALQAIPEDADCWNNLGVAQFLGGDAAAAEGSFRKALLIAPAYANALLNLIDLLEPAGRASEAVAACDQFLASGDSDEVRRRLADLHCAAAREILARAGTLLEANLRAQSADDATRERLGRLLQAQEALAGEPEPGA